MTLKVATHTDALQQLFAHIGSRPMGHNLVMVGDRPRYILAHLDNPYESIKFNQLVCNIYQGDQTVMTFRIDLTDAQYRDGARPDLRTGGYYRTDTDSWYGWMPDVLRLTSDLCDIFAAHEVPLIDGAKKAMKIAQETR